MLSRSVSRLQKPTLGTLLIRTMSWRLFSTRRLLRLLEKEKADQRRRLFITALHRLTLIPRMALNRAPASLSAQAVKHSDQNRQPVNSFDLFRSTCFVRFGPRLSPCPPQPLGAKLRASSRRPSGRFRGQKLVGLAAHSKRFFRVPECVWIMTKPREPVRVQCLQGRLWRVLPA